MFHRVTDWTDAYTNGAHIPEGSRWPGAWEAPAAAFRERLSSDRRAELGLSYGAGGRNSLDLFLPDGPEEPKGLVVFVHGGYWVALDRSYWSQFAAGPLAHGHAVAIPSYTLCPDIRIADIKFEIAAAVALAASRVRGPIRLVGHSAGGHLVTRLVCSDTPLAPDIRSRIAHVLSLSGLHDLRPLLKIETNAKLRLDEAEATVESPALLRPIDGVRLTCWVGGAERAEFRRQNALLSNIWTGLGASTRCVEEPDRHHFDVLDGLADPNHSLTKTLLEG